MGHVRIFVGLLTLLAVAYARGDDKPEQRVAPLLADLKKLEGTWAPIEPVDKVGSRYLEFDKDAKNGKDCLTVIHAVDGGGKMLNVGSAVVKFELKEDGKKRVICPVKAGEGVSPIVYRFDGDTLIVEEGDATVHYKIVLKGKWKRLKGESLP
jgi:hypothetical protein